MEVRPNLVLEDIEVAHRLCKLPPHPQPSQEEAVAEGDDTPPSLVETRPIIVKLASWRTKALLMNSCKNLKDNPVICNNGTNA